MSENNNDPESAIVFSDISPAIEFGCWVVVFLAPFLRWINGAAVTDDQFVIQVALVSMALVGGLSLRFYNWRQGKQRDKTRTDSRNDPNLQSDNE